MITRDNELIAGQRRLEACKRLGWEAIPAVVAENITDAVARLEAERDENECRKAMLPSEQAALGARLFAGIQTGLIIGSVRHRAASPSAVRPSVLMNASVMPGASTGGE